MFIALAACGQAAIPEFPIGFYGVRTLADAEFLRAHGFDAFQAEAEPGTLRVLAAYARKSRMLALLSPQSVLTSTYSATEFPGAVWYLKDEPDVHGMSRDALSEIESAVRRWAPGTRTAFVVGDGRKAKNYPGVADVIMVDWYPVPHLPLESAGDHVRMTVEAAAGRKVWAVLQAMDWRDFPQANKHAKRIGRFPTRKEIRFMSYDAVLNGADGIWYFTYSTAPGTGLSQTPAAFEAVESTALELRSLAPVFAGGRPLRLPFNPPAKGWTARAWSYRGRDYLVLANRTGDRQWKLPEEVLKPRWRPLFEARRDQRELLKAHAGFYYLKPYQVLVLESRLFAGAR